MSLRSLWSRKGAIYFTIAMTLLHWIGYFATSVRMVAYEAEEHSQPFDWAEVWWRWADGTLENLFSEFFITAYLLSTIDWNKMKQKWYRGAEEE